MKTALSGLLMLMSTGCTVHVWKYSEPYYTGYDYGYTQPVYGGYYPRTHHCRPRARAYYWRARGCTNLNPNVCRARGW